MKISEKWRAMVNKCSHLEKTELERLVVFLLTSEIAKKASKVSSSYRGSPRNVL